METDREECTRCGDCCRASSPTLHLSDLELIREGRLLVKDLYSVRIGEPVYDNLNGKIGPSPMELVKVRHTKKGCIFLAESGNACLIYEDRPQQCRAMKCWDQEEFRRKFSEPKLSRWDVVEDIRILALMEEHERRCQYALLKENLKDIERLGDSAVEAIVTQLRFDHHVRVFSGQKLGTASDETDFYYGRSLLETIEVFGLQVTRRMDGTFFLTALRRQ